MWVHCTSKATVYFVLRRLWCCFLLQAFAYLREEVRDFLGQPIRARIKGTIVQRPSSVTKKTHYTYPSVQNVYNGQQQVRAGVDTSLSVTGS